MQFWDRIAGGAAAVSVELDKPFCMPGETMTVKATISANGELEAKSALIRLRGEEDEYKRPQTVEARQRIPGPTALSQGQQDVLEGQLTVPYNAPPTYAGPNASHASRLSVELDVAWSANPGDNLDVVIGLWGPE